MAASASSSDQAPLASSRIRPAGPRASRTAATRSRSARSGQSPTLTLTVVTPVEAASPARRAATSGPTAGTSPLTGTVERTGTGQRSLAADRIDRQASTGSQGYPGKGENSPQPAG